MSRLTRDSFCGIAALAANDVTRWQPRAIRSSETTLAINRIEQERNSIVASIEFRQSQLEQRANQLLSSSWQILQGIAFENFLVHVLENLGASVQITPTTGDQGADLIASIAGKKFAIQAKGGVSVIGNGAVMEALAGMHFYGCDIPVVITNSRFTPKAEELAERANCLLIDGSALVDLALGRHFIMQPSL